MQLYSAVQAAAALLGAGDPDRVERRLEWARDLPASERVGVLGRALIEGVDREAEPVHVELELLGDVFQRGTAPSGAGQHHPGEEGIRGADARHNAFVEQEVSDVPGPGAHRGGKGEALAGLIGEPLPRLIDEDRSVLYERSGHGELPRHGEERCDETPTETLNAGPGLAAELESITRRTAGSAVRQLGHRGNVLTDQCVVAREAPTGAPGSRRRSRGRSSRPA